ncbi:MAG TPA: T9SS type A sorting domain-containing protein, partial [bacterium (Candidatus Stahlbacteria)]|nr:T9SS type A sorting domain-containing protein [Candidatus Stahlbacteria bacterium]
MGNWYKISRYLVFGHLLLLTLYGSLSKAQNTVIIKGIVTDKVDAPVESVIVKATDVSDTSRYFTGISDPNGYYELEISVTAVAESSHIHGITQRLQLLQNYPNPFSSKTIIRYKLIVPAHTTLIIYNLSGRLVNTLVDRYEEAGLHTIYWDGSDSYGKVLPSGIYFCKLQAGNFFSIRKLVMLHSGGNSYCNPVGNASGISTKMFSGKSNFTGNIFDIRFSKYNITDTVLKGVQVPSGIDTMVIDTVRVNIGPIYKEGILPDSVKVIRGTYWELNLDLIFYNDGRSIYYCTEPTITIMNNIASWSPSETANMIFGAYFIAIDAVDISLSDTSDIAYFVPVSVYYRDADGDGYGDPSITVEAFSCPAGYVSDSTDCDDSNPDIHPGATEVCNGVDDDCDALTDEEGAYGCTTYYR